MTDPDPDSPDGCRSVSPGRLARAERSATPLPRLFLSRVKEAGRLRAKSISPTGSPGSSSRVPESSPRTPGAAAAADGNESRSVEPMRGAGTPRSASAPVSPKSYQPPSRDESPTRRAIQDIANEAITKVILLVGSEVVSTNVPNTPRSGSGSSSSTDGSPRSPAAPAASKIRSMVSELVFHLHELRDIAAYNLDTAARVRNSPRARPTEAAQGGEEKRTS